MGEQRRRPSIDEDTELTDELCKADPLERTRTVVYWPQEAPEEGDHEAPADYRPQAHHHAPPATGDGHERGRPGRAAPAESAHDGRPRR